ncbi:hypothetical protein BD324DRAFT_650522 [Kockovaella imperatae]|uniref:Uncharacterized protein n=1 Tax=Kockovaella imperatae TaxID=4999 RepID=A0A1Y1UJ22_9TREE|nr:hypothetical protein BD324DRAFT_650522 [Kockovaella imperatae]ORX37982.1 hypothetical protein BD324DRAFT_650522 [Kockovaella imperatae]
MSQQARPIPDIVVTDVSASEDGAASNTLLSYTRCETEEKFNEEVETIMTMSWGLDADTAREALEPLKENLFASADDTYLDQWHFYGCKELPKSGKEDLNGLSLLLTEREDGQGGISTFDAYWSDKEGDKTWVVPSFGPIQGKLSSDQNDDSRGTAPATTVHDEPEKPN